MLQDLLREETLHTFTSAYHPSTFQAGNSMRMKYSYVPILVPLNTALALLLVMPTDWTFTPGAKISTAAPKFENEALVSVDASMAPTVMAEGAEAGEVELASICFLFCQDREARWKRRGSTLSFPAATTTTTPALVSAAIALFSAVLLLPPILMFSTAFPANPLAVAFVATKFRPWITAEFVPAPSASRTFTATRETALATP
jgi:hypothetical protein